VHILSPKFLGVHINIQIFRCWYLL